MRTSWKRILSLLLLTLLLPGCGAGTTAETEADTAEQASEAV